MGINGAERNTLPDCIEGPKAFERFDALVDSVLAVPHSLIERRQRAYRKKVDANPNRRGPKRKVKPSASSGHAVDS
jgi:hypothetical protein